MSQQTLEQLLDKYESDPAFRAEMQQDPIAAAENAGIELDDQDRAVLQDVDVSQSGEELRQRMSKSFRGRG